MDLSSSTLMTETKGRYPVFYDTLMLEVSCNLRAFVYHVWSVSEGVESTMTEQHMRARVRYVIGPDGSPLTVADLPPQDTKRWVIRRKAEVVAAVRGGLLSIEEACERYKLTVDEFLSWQRSIDKHGLPGLRATRIQDYRAE